MLGVTFTSTEEFKNENVSECLHKALDLVNNGAKVTVMNNETGEIIFDGSNGLINIGADELTKWLTDTYDEGYAEGFNDGYNS